MVVVQYGHTLAVEHGTLILIILLFALQDYAWAIEHLQRGHSCKRLARRAAQPAADAHSALHAPTRHATARATLWAAQSLGTDALYRRFFFFRPVRIARARSSSSRAVVYL